jgi:Kef-type K+ transport system membrane component KefB/nucleotide-binding universal stress UspA family protein
MTDHTTATFVAQLILLLLVGRMLGEILARLGQPAIFGQLLGGIVLGPSVFGALWPELRQVVFPNTPQLKSMIDAVAQIGILLLLLLTGMETNLALISRRRRAVISTSLAGIALPGLCGILFGYALPANLVPDANARLITALLLGTALSISSVKIVAMVLMEIGAVRRDLGQLVLATAILDDTIAWVLVAVISGIAAHGAQSLAGAGVTLAATVAFVLVCLFLGRRIVASLIRWSNDYLTIEVPVITAILLIMLAAALATELFGAHTALGAFLAGILVGQSPILTEHIEDELRGLIIAFFSPVFFAVAGLNMDLRTLMDSTLLGITVAMIGVASLGKFLGAAIGGRVGGLTWLESTALGTALNARGSTEVIIASIGLSMGALSDRLYTMIVAMALVTTMLMPPTLRWVMARVPLRQEERARLSKEQAEARESVPKMERVLVAADASANGALAGQLAGLFAGSQGLLTTVVELSPAQPRRTALERVRQAAASCSGHHKGDKEETAVPGVDELIQSKPAEGADALAQEAAKGYSMAFVGVDRPVHATADRFTAPLDRLIGSFDRPVAIAINGHLGGSGASGLGGAEQSGLHVLVPTGGAAHARLATEVALAIARSGGGRVTALHVFDAHEDTDMLRGRPRRGLGAAVLRDVRRLGVRSKVAVELRTATHARPELAIRRVAASGAFDLIVLGAALRVGEGKFLGPRSAALIQMIDAPLLLIAQ